MIVPLVCLGESVWGRGAAGEAVGTGPEQNEVGSGDCREYELITTRNMRSRKRLDVRQTVFRTSSSSDKVFRG